MATGSSLSVDNIDEDLLACGICLESFHDPRGLPCLHAFCCECLKKWVAATPDRSIVICPVCMKKVDIPDGDVAGFSAHFIVKNLLDMIHKVCQTSIGMRGGERGRSRI